jgi:plasmid stability protein
LDSLDGKLTSWENVLVKTTLDLPDELVRRMKIRAVEEGRPLKRLVAELLSRSLNMTAIPAPSTVLPMPEPIVLNQRGFPLIRCGTNAPAGGMTAQELIAVEQQSLLEEDMRRGGIPL